MEVLFNKEFKADLFLDDNQRVRQIIHSGEYYLLEKKVTRDAAAEYFNKVSGIYKLPLEQLKNMHQGVSFFEPREQGIEFRQSDEKNFFDSTTIGYFQTIHNVPVWRSGMSVTIKQNPNRVVLSSNNSQENVALKLPPERVIEKWKNILMHQSTPIPSMEFAGEKDEKISKGIFIQDLLAADNQKTTPKSRQRPQEVSKFIRGRFYVYKYSEKNRLKTQPEPAHNEKYFYPEEIPTLPLNPVDKSIKEGQYYLVAEITFTCGHLNWLMLVDVNTESILYLEALSSTVNGMVYLRDPITKTGTTTNTPDQSNTILDPFRDDVTLPNLDAPVGSTQNLKGTHAEVHDVTFPNIPPPTTSGTDFDYEVRTDNFAAVNAYYHVDRFFNMVEDLGFNVPTYFANTHFPIPVDHRGRGLDYTGTHVGTGIEVNAHCAGNGTDGIGHLCFMLADLGDTSNPIGIALDWRVHLHELGGHGVLYDHVGTSNFGFSHSAGDSFAIIINDPDSQLRGTSDRFLLAPFVPSVVRRSDRKVVDGWAWGGTYDLGGYYSEQILSTTHFNIYRSIGGDHSDLGRRQFAARMMAYLMLRTISALTPGTNPANALTWCNDLMAADLLNWTSEGIFGGAYNKVIRWAFEKQGLFQSSGASHPYTSPGQPPAIDVYIDDGRQGEYPFQEVHWENQSIWNQRNISDPPVHAEPVMGATNYAFVKVKNRGISDATNVTVRAYHCLPGAGLTWPVDFTEMSPAGGLSQPLIHANSADEITFGPFSWIPNTNAYGHDCILMVASQAQDPSNVDNFTAGETIEEWRLVPNDNNVGQRNVYPVPGGGGGGGLMESLDGKIFFVRNPFRKKAKIELRVQLPDILSRAGWRMNFRNMTENQFTLKPGEKREVGIHLIPGDNFTKQQIIESKQREIRVFVYANDMHMGGMTYQLDPNLTRPYNIPGKQVMGQCKEKAEDLLNCLNVTNEKVRNVCIKKVIIDVELDNDCSCGC